MSSFRSWGLAPRVLALAAALAATPLLVPAPVAHAQADPAAINPDQKAYWRDRAATLRARVASALVREEAATAAYSRMLTRRYPAGDAKVAIIDERDLAAQELASAKDDLRQFKQQAREASVPDHWIDPEGTPPPWWVNPDS
jgi:hypothetical protein